MWRVVVTMLSLAGPVMTQVASAGPDAHRGDSTTVLLNVPFVSQGEKLCGGASLAMVRRYHGERGIDASDFAHAQDSEAGITVERMARLATDAGYDAHSFAGTLDSLRRHLSLGRPVTVLIDAPGQSLHYVVVVGVDAHAVTVHDPALRPKVVIAQPAFDRMWAAGRRWAMVIVPREPVDPAPASRARPAAHAASAEARRWTAIAHRRFGERRWNDSESAATTALALDAGNPGAWHLLGASQYMLQRRDQALSSWNRVDAPVIDLVQVEGLEHTRHAVITGALSLDAGEVLTNDALRTARRRLDLVPAVDAARVDYRAAGTGIAEVDVALVERARWSPSLSGLAVAGVRALSERRVRAAWSSPTGGGELLEASYRWWERRPRFDLALSTPAPLGLPGRARLEGAVETQTYAAAGAPGTSAETTREAVLSWAHWISSAWRADAIAGFHRIRERGHYASWGGGLMWAGRGEHRRVRAGGQVWNQIDGGQAFHARVDASLHDGIDVSPAVQLTARAGWSVVDAAAPRLLWPGAGTGEGRPGLLRAHPLIESGVITGDAFAPSLVMGGVELTHWFGGRLLGGAVFVDTAGRVSRSMRLITDAGAGLRVHPPGHRGLFRLDVATGLTDRSTAFSLAWQSSE